MKKDKSKLKGALLEGLLEIVLTLIFFGIGALIFGAFGVEPDSANVDLDLTVLLGILACAVIFGLVFALVRCFKKIVKGK